MDPHRAIDSLTGMLWPDATRFFKILKSRHTSAGECQKCVSADAWQATPFHKFETTEK
jgi:hypothetical protein